MIIISSYLSIKITAHYEKSTRAELFKKTLAADWPYLIKQRLGYLENTLMNDVQYGSSFLQELSNIIMIITSLVMYILIAINISLSITLFTLFLGLILFFLFKPTMYRIKTNAEKNSRYNKKITHFVNENIIGLKNIKAMMVNSQLIKKANSFFEEIRLVKIKIFLLRNITQAMIQPISLIFICIIFAISYKTPGFSFPAMIAVVYLIQRIFQYIQQLQARIQVINEAYPYLNNITTYTREAEENQEKNPAGKPYVFNKTLEFKNISFSYTADKVILDQISFKLEKGMMIGLIGPSGAGKTTIMDLILRLYQPIQGEILLDNQPIDKIDLTAWRKNIGYISQDMFLFNDTIENNLKFYDDSIAQAELVEAAKMADIHDFIETLPDKYQSVIGERGILLSAGQRQRLVIARILAKKPDLLILDEATSALDNESEIKIQKILEKIKGKITILAIAHRLSTVVKSDKLLVLENSQIIEQGNPLKLLKEKESYFYKVYNIRK